jgi:hypothetical protein
MWSLSTHMSRSHGHWFKFCIHLRCLNVRNFGTFLGTWLETWRRGMSFLLNLWNLPIPSKVIIVGTHRGRDRRANRRHGDLISLTFFSKQCRLESRMGYKIEFKGQILILYISWNISRGLGCFYSYPLLPPFSLFLRHHFIASVFLVLWGTLT